MNKPLLHAVLNYLVKGSSDFLIPGTWFSRPEEIALIERGLFVPTDLTMTEISCPVCGNEEVSVGTDDSGAHYVVCTQTGEIVDLPSFKVVYLKFMSAVFDKLIIEDQAFHAEAEMARFLQVGRMGRNERVTGFDRRSVAARRTLNWLLARYLDAEENDVAFNLKGSSEVLMRQLRQAGTNPGFASPEKLRQAFNYDLNHFYDLDAERMKRLAK